jgi:hypothetical protein
MGPEDIEFLNGIRGCFGSRRMWCVEYEFTGEEIIERRGGREKKRIKISDIVESKIPLGSKRMILKTNSTEMRVQIFPALNEVIKKRAAEFISRLSESERQKFEATSRQISRRYKRALLIGGIIYILIMFAFAFFVRWLMQKW